MLKGAAAQAVAAGVSPADEQALAADVLQTALRAEPALIGQVRIRHDLMSRHHGSRSAVAARYWHCLLLCWAQVAPMHSAEASTKTRRNP